MDRPPGNYRTRAAHEWAAKTGKLRDVPDPAYTVPCADSPDLVVVPGERRHPQEPWTADPDTSTVVFVVPPEFWAVYAPLVQGHG